MLLVLQGALAACGSGAAPLPRTAYGPEGMAVQEGVLLAPAAATGRPVDGLACGPPHVAFHIHAHLAVYVDGALRPIPAGIGMVDPKPTNTRTGPLLEHPKCYYPLHVHAQDGVIHAEGTEPQAYTLGEFFDIWGQPLSLSRVGPYRGRVSVFVDGSPGVGDPRKLVLAPKQVITLVVGQGVTPAPVDWSHF
ncbi:MAG: hypothetical protein JWQ74_1573 [Marmoricola sp.]|nr:hypothetical protein [Marmoricola sp.]